MRNYSVAKKLTLSFLILTVLTILVGAAGVVGMMQINRGSIEMYERQSQPLADLGVAREYFQRIRVQLRDVVLASGNIGELDLIENDFRKYEMGFITHMEAYRYTITDADIIKLYYEIMDAFNECQPSMQQIIASAKVNAPPVQMLLMMGALTAPTDFITEALDYMAYVRVLQAAYVSDINSYWFNVLFIMILAAIAIGVAVAIFLTRYISGQISKPLAEIGVFADNVSTGKIDIASIGENSINVNSSDEIGTLARVLERSYVQISEYEQAQFEMQRLAAENAILESLARMKTEYLANISHEIKTPMTVISGNVQEAAELFGELRVENGEAIVDGETIHKSLQKAQNEILRLARITENALRISAMQESHEKMQKLDTVKFFTASAEMYRGVIQKNSNTLVIHTPESLPSIYGNADQLNQVVANLLSNANKHTRNGAIELSIESAQLFLRVSIHDTGSGIPDDILPEIFERGVSGSDGTGMGLAICKNIIETHSGTINITSRQGKGTTVTFTVPVYGIES